MNGYFSRYPFQGAIHQHHVANSVYYYLRVVSTVDGQGFGDDEKSVGKGLDAELGATFDLSLVLQERVGGGDLESAGARNHGAVFQGVFHGAQTVPDGVFQLRQRVLVGTLE